MVGAIWGFCPFRGMALRTSPLPTRIHPTIAPSRPTQSPDKSDNQFPISHRQIVRQIARQVVGYTSVKAVFLHPPAPPWIENECKTLMIFKEKIGQANWLKSKTKLVNELVKQLVRRPQQIGHKIGQQIGRPE